MISEYNPITVCFHVPYLFPTCQVRVVRYCSITLCRLTRLLLTRGTSTARAARQCSPPDLNREGRVAVFSAGPQPPAPERARRCLTSTNTQPQTHNHKHIRKHNHKHTITSTNQQTQPQTHNHKHNYKHTITTTTLTTTTKNRNNHKHTITSTQSQPQHTTTKTHPQHTTTTHNHSTQPEDPQAKLRTTKLTTMPTCSSPWHEGSLEVTVIN